MKKNEKKATKKAAPRKPKTEKVNKSSTVVIPQDRY